MAIRSEPVEFIDDDDFNSLDIVRRVVFSVSRKLQPSHVTGIFGTRGSGCTSLLNMCKDFANRNPFSEDQRHTLWLKRFDVWKIAGMGNLTQALLWHIHRNLPENVDSDEKVLYKLGRLSIALSARTGQSMVSGCTPISQVETERNYELISKTLPPERKSAVSSQFSACEQIDELSGSFNALGKQLAELCGCNVLVVPIDNLDKCTPAEAMEFLFALKMMIDGNTFSFAVAADDSILSKFCNFTYGGMFSDKQAADSMLAFFDDWIHIPSPSLQTILHKVDFPVSQKEPFFTLLEATNFQTIFPVNASIRQGCKRFELFLYSHTINAEQMAKNYCGWLGWFLINKVYPGQIQEIMGSHNPEECLNTFNTLSPQEKASGLSMGNKKESSTRIVIRQQKQEMFQSAGTSSEKDPSKEVLERFITVMNSLMSTKELINRLREVYPFL